MTCQNRKSRSLWVIGVQLLAGIFAMRVSAAEPSIVLEPLSTIKANIGMQQVGALTASAQHNQLFIPIVDIPSTENGGELKIISVDLDANQKTQVLYRQEFNKNKPATPPIAPPVVYEDAAGNLILLDHLQQNRNAITKLNKKGDIIAQATLLSEDPNAHIRSSTLGAQGDILIVGSSDSSGVAMLISGDFKPLWKTKIRKDVGNLCQIVAAQFDPAKKRFVIAGFRGTYSKFGVPENSDFFVVVTTLDYEGKIIAEKSFVGHRPALAANSKEIILLSENLSAPRAGSLRRLSWDLAVEKEISTQEFIGELPIGDMPTMILDDKQRIIATHRVNSQTNLFLFDNDLKLIAKHTDKRPIGFGQPSPLLLGDALYMISAGLSELPAPKTPITKITTDVFLDQIKIK